MGKLGYDLTIDQGYEAARATGINLISTIKSAIGDLRNVKQIIRVNGMVNSASNFTDQPKVINGCSDLLVEVFGDKKTYKSSIGNEFITNEYCCRN